MEEEERKEAEQQETKNKKQIVEGEYQDMSNLVLIISMKFTIEVVTTWTKKLNNKNENAQRHEEKKEDQYTLQRSKVSHLHLYKCVRLSPILIL